MKTCKYIYNGLINTLAILLVVHFLSNIFFIHNHDFNGKQICHSHPFSNTEHTEDVASFIQFINTSVAIITECTTKLLQDTISDEQKTCVSSPDITLGQCELHSLRAPPVL